MQQEQSAIAVTTIIMSYRNHQYSRFQLVQARGMPLQEPSRPVVILPVLANGIPQQTRVLSEPKGPIQTVHMATKNKQAQPVPEKQEQKVLHQCPKITVFTSPCTKTVPQTSDTTNKYKKRVCNQTASKIKKNSIENPVNHIKIKKNNSKNKKKASAKSTDKPVLDGKLLCEPKLPKSTINKIIQNMNSE